MKKAPPRYLLQILHHNGDCLFNQQGERLAPLTARLLCLLENDFANARGHIVDAHEQRVVHTARRSVIT